MRELRTILTKYSSERLANIITFELTNTGRVNLVDAPKELLDEIKHIESIKASWDSGILRMEVVQMIWIMTKIIILSLFIIFLGFVVEIFKFDYEAHRKRACLILDAIIIIYIIFNMVVILIWM